MNVIIPVAGNGTRLLPYSDRIQKCLLPVAGKPVLQHILEPLRLINVKKVSLITGKFSDQINNFTRSYPFFQYELVHQSERLGLGHAVFTACQQKDEPLLIILGDSLFQLDYQSFISSDFNKIGVARVEDPHRFGIVELVNQDIISMVEKPEMPPSDLAIAGIYYFRSEAEIYQALQYIIRNKIRTNGEYQLTDALQYMLKNGVGFKSFALRKWLDCGIPETLLKTNAELLNFQENFISPTANVNNSIISSSSIGSGCVVENSNLTNVIMLDNSVVRNSILSDRIINYDEEIINI